MCVFVEYGARGQIQSMKKINFPKVKWYIILTRKHTKNVTLREKRFHVRMSEYCRLRRYFVESIYLLKNHRSLTGEKVTNSMILIWLLFFIFLVFFFFFFFPFVHLLYCLTCYLFIYLCDVILRICWFNVFNYVVSFFPKLLQYRSPCLLENWQTRNRLKRFQVILFGCVLYLVAFPYPSRCR